MFVRMLVRRLRDRAQNRSYAMANSGQFRQPRWWTDAHNSAWDHVREAFRTKWDQERAAGARDNAPHWDEVEPAIRFGFGARRRPEPAPEPESQRASASEWDPETEALLEQEWDTMHTVPEDGFMPRLWHDIRQFVHRGWLGP
jgi:hypothetical protein